MLGIDFLRHGKRSGLEFIDFQNPGFKDELVAAIEPHVMDKSGESVLQGSVKEDILPIIEKYCGFTNITVEMMNDANFMVDVGYLSPSNILNIKGIENWFDISESTLNQWYAKTKNKVFKGSIDYTTGKVAGAYAELPIKLYLGKPVGKIFSKKEIQKLSITIAEMIGGCIAHEIGHCFSACAMIDISANDNFVMRGALSALGAANTKEKRVTIIRNASNLLESEIESGDKVDLIAETEQPEEILIYFNALINRRNTKRALSMGVDEMSSEVLADMYAIRMGFDRGITATLKIFASKRVKDIFATTGYVMLVISGIFMQMLLVSPLVYLLVMMGMLTLTFTLIYGAFTYSGTYNSPFRRFEDSIRQMIAKLKEVDMSAKDKLQLAETIEILLKQCEKYRPIISGTVIDRMLGRVIQGSDYKYQEFEHFTQTIANNELEVLNTKLANLTA